MTRRQTSPSPGPSAPDQRRAGEEITLPSDPEAPLDLARRQIWMITIAWHPRIERIGAVCEVESGAVTLGRSAPRFLTPDGCEVGLDDPHVSRAACSLAPVPADAGRAQAETAWHLTRKAGASRLRCDGRELTGKASLTAAEAESGFTLALGDRVLLHLRRTEAPAAPADAQTEEADALTTTLRGVSPAMRTLRAAIANAARSGDDVLLIGPTGTGKELAARAIHARGSTEGAPWVPVNMAAIPVDLAAASLFGARRGAFTGADAHREGYFQQARGGTLFLDEVGDTPPALQPLLLRALQEREVQVVGGQPERVDLRVISAMERDPDDAGFDFRGALRHRLGRQEIHLPPLAHRAEDVGLLAAGFLAATAASAGGLWPPPRGEHARWLRLFELFLVYPWPGNVRELEHAVAQLRAASADGRLRVPGALLERLRRGAEAREVARRETGTDPEVPQSAGGIAEAASEASATAPARLADLDDEALYDAWLEAGCEVATLARRYGVSRPAVYRRIKTSRRCRLAADVPLHELLAVLEACRGDLAQTAERLAVSRRGLETRLRSGAVPVTADGAAPEGTPPPDGA